MGCQLILFIIFLSANVDMSVPTQILITLHFYPEESKGLLPIAKLVTCA